MTSTTKKAAKKSVQSATAIIDAAIITYELKMAEHVVY